MEVPKNVVNPFSDKFLETWSLWKMHRFEQDGFRYKGVISEQMALKHLVDLTEGEEEKAVKIINQSIRRQWPGFYPLKETTHGTKQSNPKQGKQPDVSLTERVIKAANQRYGNGESPSDSGHLKAV